MNGFHKKLTKQGGFSLVELMIVVGIIGILATLAMPRFQQFQAKARMGEAKNMLNHVYTLEESYFLDRDIYLNMVAYGSANAGGNCNAANGAALGFTINPCNAQLPRYAYSVAGATTVAFTASGVTGTGAQNQVCPSSPAHTFTMDQNRLMNGPTGC